MIRTMDFAQTGSPVPWTPAVQPSAVHTRQTTRCVTMGTPLLQTSATLYWVVSPTVRTGPPATITSPARSIPVLMMNAYLHLKTPPVVTVSLVQRTFVTL